MSSAEVTIDRPRIELHSDAATVFALVTVAGRTQVRVYFEMDPDDIDQEDPPLRTSTSDPSSAAWHAVLEWLAESGNRQHVVALFRTLASPRVE